MLVFVLTLCALLATFPTAAKAQNYYTGDYKICMNLYSFNENIIAWVQDRKGAPPLDTISAVKWAKQAGFDSVNIPMYYIPGYEGNSMPSKPTADIIAFIRQVKQTAADLGLNISGTGIGNDFANADPKFLALEVDRALFWINMASEMGASYMRVFSGLVPEDFNNNWEEIAKYRIVPILLNITTYAASKNVKIGMQNHGDMTCTADQTIQIVKWVNHPNLGVVDDTGYFRPFRADNGLNYDWYTDISKVLPFSVDLQTKIKPAGAEQAVMMDYRKLFTDLRSSPFRDYVTLERLWDKNDPDNPKNQTTPPYTEVQDFYHEVAAALEATKIPPTKN